MQNMGSYLLEGTILLLAFLMTLPFISTGLATGNNPTLGLFFPNEIDMLSLETLYGNIECNNYNKIHGC